MTVSPRLCASFSVVIFLVTAPGLVRATGGVVTQPPPVFFIASGGYNAPGPDTPYRFDSSTPSWQLQDGGITMSGSFGPNSANESYDGILSYQDVAFRYPNGGGEGIRRIGGISAYLLGNPGTRFRLQYTRTGTVRASITHDEPNCFCSNGINAAMQSFNVGVTARTSDVGQVFEQTRTLTDTLEGTTSNNTLSYQGGTYSFAGNLTSWDEANSFLTGSAHFTAYAEFTGTVSVEVSSACTYSISPSSGSFPASGGTGDVSVTATGGCDWTAQSNNPWITINSGASGTANRTVNYSVVPNSGPQRNGSITVAGQTFTVSQQSGCSYSVNPTGQGFPSTGGTGIINVTAGALCNWSAASNDSWITVTSGVSGTGIGMVEYLVASNTATASRSGTLNVAGKVITISQTSESADVTISKEGSPNPVASGSEIMFTIAVGNNGPSTAASVEVSDELPGQTTLKSCISSGSGVCVVSGNGFTVTFVSLGSGSSETITVAAKVNDSVPDGTTIFNTARVSSPTFDPDRSNNITTSLTRVTSSDGPSVRVEKVWMSDNHTLEVDVVGQFSRVAFTQKSLTVSFTLNGVSLSNTLSLASGAVGSQRKTFSFDLQSKVPRFTENQFFDVAATATEGGVDSESIEPSPKAAILLPVVIVPGIQPYCFSHCVGGDNTHGSLEQFLMAESKRILGSDSRLGDGYALRGVSPNYPTLFTLSYETNSSPFYDGAATLKLFIEEIVKSRTFADKVNLVTHSKGGLVARAFLVSSFINAGEVKQLIMCAPPNLGSLYAVLDSPSPLDVEYSNLYPLWPWLRSTAQEPFRVPSDKENGELDSLNGVTLPVGIPYTIIYSNSNRPDLRTDFNFTLSPPTRGQFDGDKIVPSFSAIGRKYDPNAPNQIGDLIPAFVNRFIGKVAIDGQHSGYLDLRAVQDSILYRLFSLTPTQSGTNITSQLGTTSITFSSVSTAGSTSLTTIAPPQAAPPPPGYSILGPALDISTTARFSGPITVCEAIPSETDQAMLSRLRLLHGEGGILVDRTTSNDSLGMTICATVPSLSPFVLAAADDSADFDICIQDESEGNLLRFNSTTGDYKFTNCDSGFTLTGRGTVTVKGALIKLKHTASDRTIVAKVKRKKATASVEAASAQRSFNITDKDLTNNSCGCP